MILLTSKLKILIMNTEENQYRTEYQCIEGS